MIWAGWNEFIAMGGYGLYVWGSLGMVAVALALEVASVRQRRRAILQSSLHQGEKPDETAA